MYVSDLGKITLCLALKHILSADVATSSVLCGYI